MLILWVDIRAVHPLKIVDVYRGRSWINAKSPYACTVQKSDKKWDFKGRVKRDRSRGNFRVADLGVNRQGVGWIEYQTAAYRGLLVVVHHVVIEIDVLEEAVGLA